tara:strand:+ start:85 stop:573 length:489 start_codon:yes stop_codon:yes gene_type:complete
MSLPFLVGATVATTLGAAAVQSSAQKASANFNQQVAERNASVQEQQADQNRLQSELAIADFKDQFRGFQSQIEAQQYKSGVEVGTGTALEILIENAEEADKEIANRRFNAATNKRALEDSAVMSRLQGQLGQMQGRQARIGTFFGAGRSLLSTGLAVQPYVT